MRKYYIVHADTLEEMLKCFSSEDEYLDFHEALTVLGEDLQYIHQCLKREPENKDQAITLSLKKLFILGLFIKQNIEVIHQVISKLQYKEKDNLTDE